VICSNHAKPSRMLSLMGNRFAAAAGHAYSSLEFEEISSCLSKIITRIPVPKRWSLYLRCKLRKAEAHHQSQESSVVYRTRLHHLWWLCIMSSSPSFFVGLFVIMALVAHFVWPLVNLK